MKTNHLGWTKALLSGCALLMLQGCDRSSEPVGKGEVEFRITDLPPVDDASVKGVFLTVSDIKVDGKSIPGFTRQTVDLKAYQDGLTKSLVTTQLDARGYDNLTLVLDAESDASGNSPGSYVLTTDDQKFQLKNNGKVEVAISQNWSVSDKSKSIIVLDFDIRRAIRRDDDPSIRFSFVSDDEMRKSLRLVNQDVSGAISGTYSDPRSNGDKVIVYAYKKGTYNASTETQPGSDGILFKNALSSAEIKDGSFSKVFLLSFLEPGGYELHFATYRMNTSTNQFEFNRLLRAQTSVADTIGVFVNVERGTTTSVSSMILYRYIPGVPPDFDSPS